MEWLVFVLMIVTFVVTQWVFIWAGLTLRRSPGAAAAYWAVLFTGSVQWVFYVGQIGMFIAGRLDGVIVWNHVLTG